ncbi:MAG: alpha/beta hydrolase [Pseudomonadota bacterium]|nr:alpha/beta hydrolase [Pseudomonadota bacterium]
MNSLYKSEEGFQAIMDWYKKALTNIDTEFSSHHVDTRFGKTHILVAGPESGEPIILIPGVAGCAPLWRRQIPDFAKHFRVYALDIVGQPGKSDPNTPSFLNEDFSEWLIDVLDSLKLEKAHIAGTSVGGWIALRFGIYAPERVLKIIMLSPTGISRAKLPLKVWVTKYLNKWQSEDALENDLTAKSVTNKSPGRSFGTFDRQLAKLMALCTKHYRVDRSLGIYNRKTRKVNLWLGIKVIRKFFFSEPRSLLSKFKVPGLLVFGEYEVLYNPWTIIKRIKKIIPNLETEVITGAGHAAIYDKPEEVNNLIIKFLKD